MSAAEKLDDAFVALADATRRNVVNLLSKKPRRAGELARSLGMSAPAMSRHLRVLRQTGLVEERLLEDDARVRVYRLRPERFADLRRWLDDVEAFWGDQLASFKSYAEETRKRKTRRA